MANYFNACKRKWDLIGTDFKIPTNIWLGTTMESMDYAARAVILAGIDAPVKFLSIEPMLGPVTVSNDWQWIICGSESGRKKRHCDPVWMMQVQKQCEKLGIPFFLKQAQIRDALVKAPKIRGEQWLQFPTGG